MLRDSAAKNAMVTPPSATLAKGLRLLRAVIADNGKSTLSVIAAAQNMPLPTAHRLVITLEEEGFLARSQKGIYYGGPSLSTLGRVSNFSNSSSFNRGAQVAAALRRPLAQLAKSQRAVAHFGILEEGMVTYLVKENGGRVDLFTAETMQLEAYCTGIGKILLAALSERQLDLYLSNGPFIALTDRTLTNPEDIRRELEEVRRTGVAFDRREIHDNLFCVAVPLLDEWGLTLGGLSLSFLDAVPNEKDQKFIIKALKSVVKKFTNIRKAMSLMNSP